MISKIVIMPLFEKLEYIQPFEQSMVAFFDERGLKSIGSLRFLNPSVKYTIAEIKKKCDSLGADGILVFTYKGTDKTEAYVPETTYVTGDFGGYWGGGYWGGGFYGGGFYGGAGYYNTISTGGYWTSSSVVNLEARLYAHASKDPLWKGEIQVTDPQYVDQASVQIARSIYSHWKNDNLLKSSGK
jgi:hypothetical protein